MNNLHPLFATLLHEIERQPLILHRAAVKADARRFTGGPTSAFAALSEPENSCQRDIAGFEGRYAITNDGRVWSYPRPGAYVRWLAIHSDRKGYQRVYLFDGKRLQAHVVSRLVLAAFVGPAPSLIHQANHKNGNKADDRIENLEWVTPVENTHHAIETGLISGRSPRFLTIEGRTAPVSGWSRHPTLTAEVVSGRIFENGWAPDAALRTQLIQRGYCADGTPKSNRARELRSGFGGLDAEIGAIDRYNERGDTEAHMREENAERIGKGE